MVPDGYARRRSESHSVAGFVTGSRIGVGQGYAADAVGPVQLQRLRRGPRQGTGRADDDRNVGTLGKGQNASGISRRCPDADIPRNRHETANIKLGRNQRKKDRNRVVDSRIRVNDSHSGFYRDHDG